MTDADAATRRGEPCGEPTASGADATDTWVVVPAYNEAAQIGEVVRGLRARGPHVVVVDDGSGDETGHEARRAGAAVLRHLLNRGQGAALQTGIEHALAAGAGYLVTFDADGQHRPEDIERLLEPLRGGRAEVALGSRFLGSAENLRLSRRLLLKAAVLFTRLTSGLAVTDAHNGLRAFSRRAAARLDLAQDRMAHASELLDQVARSGLHVVEVPVHLRYTAYSRAKGQRPLAALRILADYLLGRWTH